MAAARHVRHGAAAGAADIVSRVKAPFGMPDEWPWKGVQPKCDAVVRIAPGSYGISAHLPDGSPVTIRLGGLPKPPEPWIQCRPPQD